MKKKSTKKSLLMSVVSLMLCVSMLIGTTFAWFTDQVTSGVNKITAGNLDIELYHSADGAASVSDDARVSDETMLFQTDKWEPGKVVYENFIVKNEGNLALKYYMGLNRLTAWTAGAETYDYNYVVEANGTVTDRSLMDVIKVAILNGQNFTGDRTEAQGLTYIGTLKEFISAGNTENPGNEGFISVGSLEAGGERNFSIVLYWPSDTEAASALAGTSLKDNDYNLQNGKYASDSEYAKSDSTPKQGDVGELFANIGVVLNATQYTSEYDSFGKEYDIEPGSEVPFDKPVAIASALVHSNREITLNTDKGSVTIPQDAGLPEGTIAHLEINEADTYNENLTVIEGNTVISYDVELLDQNGNKIDLSESEGKTLQACLEVGYGLEADKLQVYRDGTTELTVIKYEDGFVYFESDHFCDIDVILEGVKARIGNTYYYSYDDVAEDVVAGTVIEGVAEPSELIAAIEAKHGDKYMLEVTDNQVTVYGTVAMIGSTKYDTIEKAVAEANAGDTIKLVNDAYSGGLQIVKDLTIDLNGKTYQINASDGFIVKSCVLTLTDSSSEQTGTINHTGAYDIADISDNGTLAIDKGTYITNSHYGCLWIGNGTSAITGGRFNQDVICATGYTTTLVDGWYKVEKENCWIHHVADSYASDAKDESAKTLNIATAEELALFATEVNNGTSYQGWTVKLTDNIDLAGRNYSDENASWIPITGFKGTFDGNGKCISNLCLNKETLSDQGFFGRTNAPAVIKNLVIENADVTGYLNVGVVAGTPYTASYSNITVQGDIHVNGYAYVGGMFGKNLYVDASNLTVNANSGSYVKADSEIYRTYVGGIVGFMGEGGHTLSNVSSNIDVYGSTCDVGGITGIAHYYNKFVNCRCSGNVYITGYRDDGDQLEIGGIAGVWHNESGTTVTFTDCSFKGTVSATKIDGTTFTGPFAHDGVIGRKYGNGSGKLMIDGVEYSE